jgi:hypothetical protein
MWSMLKDMSVAQGLIGSYMWKYCSFHAKVSWKPELDSSDQIQPDNILVHMGNISFLIRDPRAAQWASSSEQFIDQLSGSLVENFYKKLTSHENQKRRATTSYWLELQLIMIMKDLYFIKPISGSYCNWKFLITIIYDLSQYNQLDNLRAATTWPAAAFIVYWVA